MFTSRLALMLLGIFFLLVFVLIVYVVSLWQKTARVGHKQTKDAPRTNSSFRPKLELDVDSSPILNPHYLKEVSDDTPYFLVFDTESFDAIEEDKDFSLSELSPIIALSWQLLNKNKQLLHETSYVIRRSGTMTDKAKAIHLITDKEIHQGAKLEGVLTLFLADLIKSKVLVAHNLHYHLEALYFAMAECCLDDKEIKQKNLLCTMMKGLELGFKRRQNGERLYPALDELFAYLYFARPRIKLTYQSKTLRDIRLVSACLRRLS